MSDSSKAGWAIIVLHLVGTVGMLLPEWAPLMKQLTPLNLLIVATLVIVFQRNKTTSFYAYALLCFLIAFVCEVVGVHTGWPFGSYEYGATLGEKVFGVPILIGVNWLVLVLCSASITQKVGNKWLAALLGAGLMVALDLLMEPVAIMSDYWIWHSPNIPLENYVSWGVLAFFLHVILHQFNFNKENEVDRYVFASQGFFFVMLNLLA